jgi:hypothetical protein
MPRKGGAGGGKGTKAAAKAATKVVQDKTFGMKNKNKSKKVQQYISQVKTQTENKYLGKKACPTLYRCYLKDLYKMFPIGVHNLVANPILYRRRKERLR